MNDDITMAQVRAGEDAVVERLRQKGLMPPAQLHIPADRDAKLAQLEHSLTTTFVTLQRERVPERRRQLWNQCLEFAAQLERLNDTPTGND